VSCLIAGGAFYYEYKTSFNEAIAVTTACVVVYWIIQAISFAYYYFVEQNEIFSGSQKLDGKVIKREVVSMT
jgi:signal peptidase complex subunit 2